MPAGWPGERPLSPDSELAEFLARCVPGLLDQEALERMLQMLRTDAAQ